MLGMNTFETVSVWFATNRAADLLILTVFHANLHLGVGNSIVGWRCMLSVDELVGAVVETISELKLLSNTFIFFTCDYAKSALARLQSINNFPVLAQFIFVRGC